jgi:hydroxypyruvate isomerase
MFNWPTIPVAMNLARERSINPFLFRCLDRIGYRGWIGCEYKPKTTTTEGLGWYAIETADT